MMFHGAQGLNRNLQRALDMFRDAADEGDANAMFNAGIIEYRVRELILRITQIFLFFLEM